MTMHFALPVSSARLSRRAIEDQIEALISMLDQLDGDPDHEEDQEDCCAAYDDCCGGGFCMRGLSDGLAGDPDDAEEDYTFIVNTKAIDLPAM